MCGLIVFMGSTPVEKACAAFILALAYLIGLREAMPYKAPETNTLAYSAAWSIVLTVLMAFIILDEPFVIDEDLISLILILINLVVFGLMLKSQFTKARKALMDARHNKALALRVAELEGKATSLYSIEVSIKVTDAQRLVVERPERDGDADVDGDDLHTSQPGQKRRHQSGHVLKWLAKLEKGAAQHDYSSSSKLATDEDYIRFFGKWGWEANFGMFVSAEIGNERRGKSIHDCLAVSWSTHITLAYINESAVQATINRNTVPWPTRFHPSTTRSKASQAQKRT